MSSVEPTPKSGDSVGQRSSVEPTPKNGDSEGQRSSVEPTPKSGDSEGQRSSVEPTPKDCEGQGEGPSVEPTSGNSKPKPKKASSGSRRRKRKAKGKAAAAKQKEMENQNRQKYLLGCSVWEDHGKIIYGCALTVQSHPEEPLLLATVGGNRSTVYSCSDDGHLKIVEAYEDPDLTESFYCCALTKDRWGYPILAIGGLRGIIRLFSLSPFEGEYLKHVHGHGDVINDITFHPQDGYLMLTASKDHSMRLWNIHTDICVAIFGGVDGHLDEVLSVDIKADGSRILSCGMDHNIRVWKITKRLEIVMRLSHSYDQNSSRAFPTFKLQFADYMCRDVHQNYVDCGKWFGDLILSKSCDGSLICWKGGTMDQDWDELVELDLETTEKTIIHEFELEDCNVRYIRFSMDLFNTTLAMGNTIGKSYVYDLSADPVSSTAISILTHPKCNAAIRQTALSRNGDVLICVCEDSTIWRWNINPNFSPVERN